MAPLDARGAAKAVGVSLRSLDDFLTRNRGKKLCERRRQQRVLYPEHIRELRRL